MYALITIHIISILFMGISLWLMSRYLRRYKLPPSKYERLWGFFRIKYLMVIYALLIVGWGVITTGSYYLITKS